MALAFLESASSRRQPITSEGIVSIRGRHLFVGSVGNSFSRRFYLRGIAFPIPPPSQTKHYYFDDDDGNQDEQLIGLDLSGWISVLEQLAFDTDINVIRLYEMDCRFDYSPFLSRAAELGIYVLVPLTTIMGPGVLGRDDDAPACYPPELYNYGRRCLDNYWDHPNVLAGVVGNEVMNDLGAWRSAPCVKAYLDDMARYGNEVLRNTKDGRRRALPLMYAAQHDSPSAEQFPADAIKLTADYLSCRNDSDDKYNNILEDKFVMGINIESWCSSLQTFELEENGVDESSYYTLWRTLSKGTMLEIKMDAVTGEITEDEVPTISPDPVTFPVVFSEMGCSKKLFNRDNGVQPKFVRDWKQIPVASENGEMSDVISGFVAYGYDGGGNVAFRMMGGEGEWDGATPLPTTSPDYQNFRAEVSKVARQKDVLDGTTADISASPPFSCKEISTKLDKLWGTELYPIADMPSYSSSSEMQRDFSMQISTSLLHGSPDFNPRILSAMPTSLATIIILSIGIVAALQYWKRTRLATRANLFSHTDYGSCEVQTEI